MRRCPTADITRAASAATLAVTTRLSDRREMAHGPTHSAAVSDDGSQEPLSATAASCWDATTRLSRHTIPRSFWHGNLPPPRGR